MSHKCFNHALFPMVQLTQYHCVCAKKKKKKSTKISLHNNGIPGNSRNSSLRFKSLSERAKSTDLESN